MYVASHDTTYMIIFLIYSSRTSLLLGPGKYPDWRGVLTANGTEFIQKVSSSGCGYRFGYKYHHGNKQKKNTQKITQGIFQKKDQKA